ncbi:M16 family metallopeptidase [Caenimonas aquaedulcis]|uniref:M16 family metallopeptidase n=1 Tax=Caenimonas aquaedulcis TaxID=2793270 RepID=UPI00338DBA76
MTQFLQRTAALLLSACAAAAFAQPAPDIAIPDIPYTKFVLRNGLTLLVHEDHKLPVVAVNTWYHVGSKNESPGKTGFAHLFEHLMFSGSENFNKTYLSALSQAGATSLNGTTNNDRTNYFQNVPVGMLDYALFAESDRMGHLLGVLDQKKLDLQRGVVQNEKRQGENRPYGPAYQLITENTYPAGHPYSWTVIGSMKDLDAASMEDVRTWFRTYYGPNNTTLVLAGDITPQAAREKVEKYYGDIPPGPPLAKHREWIAKRTGTHRGVLEDRVPQARLYRIWNVPPTRSATEPLLDLGAHVLGGGKTSRLYQRLVYKDQVATSATASNDAGEIAGQFDMTLTARPGGDLGVVERAAAQELAALLRTGPTDAELRLAKTAILARYARIAERVGGFGGKSDLLAECQTYTGNPHCYKDYLERIKAATPASVQAALVQWLSDGDYVLEVKPFAEGVASASGVDRTKEPAPGQPSALNLPKPQAVTLANGLRVVLVESHAAPVVNLSLIVDGGYASDPPAQPGLASFALRLMEEGTARRDATKLGQELESLGATLSTSANLDGSFLNMNALKATLPQAVDIFADVALHPAYADTDVERIRKDRLAAIQREKSNPETMALRVIPALLYGKDHAYAGPLTGTGSEAAVGRITKAELAAYHQAWFKPNNATLLVVGDTKLAELVPLLEKSLAGWKAGDVPAKNVATLAPAAKTVIYLMDKPGALQSVIHGAQLVRTGSPKERVELRLVNNIFGGTFSSRINMNLREDKHWSYGVWSQVTPALGQQPYVSNSPVQTDKTAEALQELVKEYAAIAGARPIAADELRVAQQKEAFALAGSFETTGELSGAYSAVLQYKLPADYYDTYARTVLALTPEQANALARRVIVPAEVTWVVVGDMSKVEAGIRQLNLGEVRRIDADGNPVK